jgi:hypothetical protein
MFGLFKSKEQRSADKFWKSEMGRRIVAHNAKYFGPGQVWYGFSAESERTIGGYLLERIFGVYGAEEPFDQMRLELAVAGSNHAQFVILPRNPDPSRYVSGELHNHLRACAPHNEELAKELWRDPEQSDSEFYGFTRQRSLYYNYILNGINLLRTDFDDYDGEPDWLRPFAKSMCIWHEHLYRSKIGLPLLAENKIQGALHHSDFFTLVRNGVRNPLYEWESKWGKHDNAS